MKYKTLKNGFRMPVLGIGTWHIGGEKEPDTTYDKENIIAIKAAIKLGLTHIDTAELYGGGHTEELVGEAIKGFDRDKLFITSKVLEHLRHDEIISAAKGSLQRLKTNYLDLYLIHAPNPEISIKETMKAMDFLVKKGLIKNIGVSNFSADELKEAQKHAKNKIVVNQIEYSLLVRNKAKYCSNMESETIPYCQKNDVLVTAYKPLARGELAKPGFKILDELAKKYNKTQAQIALNWLISKKNVVTIFKSTSIEHLKENLGTFGWNLKQEDMIKLERFP